MGGPCGTHDKDEKCGSSNPGNGPRLDLTVTIEEYDPSKRSELFAERRSDPPYKTCIVDSVLNVTLMFL